MINLNQSYGNWKVLKESHQKGKHLYYSCICNCGNEKTVRIDVLKKAKSISCSKCKFKDKEIFSGDRFGDWTVIKQVSGPEKRNYYEVQCKCGEKRILKGIRLRFGDSNSCRKCGSRKHGMVNSPTYTTWESMIQRCTNKKQIHFKDYGGRGIKICEQWKKFENFLEDMGERPKNKEIDRIDNDGNYCKENCRWVTRKENINNRGRKKSI